MHVFENVDELLGRSEDPCRTLHFRRHTGLLAVRLCHQQRLTLVERSPFWTAKDRAPGVRVSSDWIPRGRLRKGYQGEPRWRDTPASKLVNIEPSSLK